MIRLDELPPEVRSRCRAALRLNTAYQETWRITHPGSTNYTDRWQAYNRANTAVHNAAKRLAKAMEEKP